ncbi:MAG: ankyrin repeat domain-containing protein [Candidatus Jidaibacter sp.]|nr:ankyrin repeat domain-containing protein [Candidatus Jidaibacter sp.]
MPNIFEAIRTNNIEELKAIIESGSFDPNEIHNAGGTALHLAARLGNFEATKMLLETKKFDVNAVDDENWTPLEWVSNHFRDQDDLHSNRFEILKLLLNNPNLDLNSQNSPLYPNAAVAAWNISFTSEERKEIFEILQSRKSDINPDIMQAIEEEMANYFNGNEEDQDLVNNASNLPEPNVELHSEALDPNVANQ